MSNYITVIGLEIHAELLTDSKIFCTCSAEFGGDANSRVCPICSGMPGTLPVINEKAVKYAVKAGLALGCDINKFSCWDRKNYFYPDLPKAYQISQLYYPLCVNGVVPITVDGKKKNIRIHQIHLEEDAGKLVHDDLNGVSYPDYNRCGIPLIEIVSEPDLSSAEEARTYVEQIILLLQYAGVSDCKLEEGSIRCDVNISLMKPGDKEYGTRAEIKNLNSLKSIVRAIDFEQKRQAKLLDAGKKVVQETRRFNDNRGETIPMRSKENAHDYRYFPEPDILQVNFTDEMLDEIKNELPKLPDIRLSEYLDNYGLSEVDARIIISSKKVSDFFDAAVGEYNSPKSICSFVLTELLRRINLGECTMDSLGFTPADFAHLVKMADTEKVSKNDAKKILRVMIETNMHPEDIAKEHGYIIEVDFDKVNSVIKDVLHNNDKTLEQYISGETKVFGFLMGQCSKSLKGAATPKIIKESLEKILKSLSEGSNNQNDQNEDIELGEIDTSKLTKYTGCNVYKPEEAKIGRMISSDKILKEFDLFAAKKMIGEETEFSACVHKVKKMGSISFIVLRTGRAVIQTVYNEHNCKDSIEGLREGFFVKVKGVINENTKDSNGIEIVLSSIKLVSNPRYEYPLKINQGKLNCSLDVNLDNRSVALRNPYERAIFKLQEGIMQGFAKFMLQNNFTQINSPKIVAQGAEGGANIFHLEYFGKPAFLNQSPQFYKQTAVAFFDRVFEINPVYRAERHATSRHLNEYIGLDFEMGYIDSMYDVMVMETAMLKFLMSYLKENYSYEIDMVGANIPQIKEIPSVTFIEAMKIIRGDHAKNKFDLEPEDEVFLCEYAKKEFGSEFIFVTHFPSAKRPFYAMNDKDDPRVALSFDLLFRGLEITTGGQRIHDYDDQITKMKAMGMDINDFPTYLDIHKYGMPPHGGLGIGLERLLMKLLEMPNVRQSSMFPRDLNRLLP